MPTALSDIPIERQIAALLIKFLAEKFDGEDLYDTLEPLITILVRVGVQQGAELAESTLAGIMSDRSYSSWRVIIEAATPTERIAVMEVAEQEAIVDRLRALQAEREWLSVGKVMLQIVLAMAALLV